MIARRWRPVAVALGTVAAVVAAAADGAAQVRTRSSDAIAPPPPLLEEVPIPAAAPPAVTASAWMLLDDTGQVLASASADEPRPVASTVKLLTALTVVERAALDETVVIADAVDGVGGADTSVDAGEVWTIRQLLEALLVRSGNDAAIALAVHVGGTLDGFMELMRDDASALGIEPVLVTPSGLDDRNRLTARDLAVVARAVLQYPALVEIAGLRTISLPDLGTVATRNLLLDRYPGADGLKTGFTTASGHSVVGTATRDGRTLIAVVLGAADEQARFDDAEALLDHGFTAWDEVRVGRTVSLREGGRWVEVATPPGWVSVPTGTEVRVDWRLPRRPSAPGAVTVHVPRVDPIVREAAATPAADRDPTVATWLRDRLHEALRSLAASGPLNRS